MNIFVTGATGFIGGHLVRRLVGPGNNILCLVRDEKRARWLREINAEVVVGSLDRPEEWTEALREVEEIYHLAGVTRARTNQEYYRGNYLATKRLVEFCRSQLPNLKRFVHLSSLAAVGPSLDGMPVREDSGFHPVSHYGKSKMMGEQEVWKARDDLPITIIRPVAIYGPGDEAFLEYFRLVSHGILPLIGRNRKLINLIYVDDLIEGILLAKESPKSVGESYFLGDDEAYSTEEVGITIAHIMGATPIRIHLPHLAAYGYGAICEILNKISKKPAFFNLQKAREGVQGAWICSIEKAKSDLRFAPRISLFEGMKKTYWSYRENGSL